MDIIKQITKSRQILKEVLSDEYNTDNLPIYDINEIDTLFTLESTKENPYSILGQGNACNFSVNHRILKNHKLHILYYNFQRNNKTKVTKTIIDKILKLYNDNSINFLRNISNNDLFSKSNIFFYLDAHGSGNNLPLREEVELIFKNFATSIVMIDDFEVPGTNYGFDTRLGHKLNINLLNTLIELVPNYSHT